MLKQTPMIFGSWENKSSCLDASMLSKATTNLLRVNYHPPLQKMYVYQIHKISRYSKEYAIIGVSALFFNR